MATKKRSYADGCATAHALELIGERWGLLVIRELMLGPKRFTDLRTSLPGVSANVLTQRLEELERASIVRRRRLPPACSGVTASDQSMASSFNRRPSCGTWSSGIRRRPWC